MKVTKRNGNMVIYDDQKNIKSILKANAEVACETISEKEAAAIVGQIFSKLAETSTIITTDEIRVCTEKTLREKGYSLFDFVRKTVGTADNKAKFAGTFVGHKVFKLL